MKKLNHFTDFADWYFETVLPQVNHYKSDCFHDAHKIMSERINALSNSEKPLKESYYLFVRETGTHLVTCSSDDVLQTLARNNNKVYQIDFCFNSDYHFQPFAALKEIDINSLK